MIIFFDVQDVEGPVDLDLLVLQARFQSEVLGLCETVASLVRARHDTIDKVRGSEHLRPGNYIIFM